MDGEESFIVNVLMGKDGGQDDEHSGLDFRRVSELSLKHGLKPLIYSKTKNHIHLPTHFKEDLQHSYHKTLMKNIVFFNELRMLSSRFEKEKINFLVFKGLVLAEEFYKDIGLRPMADIDILVQRADVSRARKTLEVLGYSIPTGFDTDFALKYRSHMPYLKESDRLVGFELHWSITQKARYGMAADSFFREAKTYTLDDFTVKSMASERLLSYLCLHFTHHLHYPEGPFRPKLIWLYDIHLMVQNERVDWDRFIRDAECERTKTALYVTLHLVNLFFGSSIPKDVLRSLQPGLIRRRLLHYLIDADTLFFRRFPKSKLCCTLISELLIQRWVDRISFTLKFIYREVELFFK